MNTIAKQYYKCKDTLLSALPFRSFTRRRARGFYSIAKVFVLTIIFFLSITTLLPRTALAQSDYASNTNANVPENSYTKTQVMLIDLSAAVMCQLVGIDMIDQNRGCLGIDPQTKKIGYVPQDPENPRVGGILGMVVDSTGALYTQPASGIDYTKNLAHNFGIIKPAVAQEPDPQGEPAYTGFTALQPIQYVWTIARNITYFFFVIAFVIIGIGIMLRLKINPQTVMSIQNQIPKITIAIIMITFSYAIIGFMIDLMWVSTYFVINSLSPAVTVTGDSTAETVREMATMNLYNNPMAYFNDLFDSPQDYNRNVMAEMSVSIGRTIGEVVGQILLSAFSINANSLGCNIAPSVQFSWPPITLGEDSVGDCVLAGVYNVGAFFISIMGILIIAVALIVAAVKTWFMLIKSYLYLMLYAIVGPIYIFMGILPGSTLGFTAWLRAITVNLLVFPSVIALYLLARFFAVSNSPFSYENTVNTQYNPFLPPLIGNPSLLNNIGLLMAFGLVMLTPELITILRDRLNAKPNPYLAPAIQGGFKAGIPLAAGITGGLVAKTFKVGGAGNPIGVGAQYLARAGRTDNGKRDDRLSRRVIGNVGRYMLSIKNADSGKGGGH